MKVKVTTDWHIGAKRTAGATPASNDALGTYMLEGLRNALDPNFPHLIMGDLLDQFTIDAATLFNVYQVLRSFLATGQELAVVRGNHDYHPRASQVSSFDLLMGILEHQFPATLTVAREVTRWRQFALVPHLPNNDLLKIEVEKLSDVENSVIVFHANYDNNFAADSQHALNLTPEMVGPMLKRGNVLALGHEHQYRALEQRRVLILGNGVPSSVADCLGCDAKFAAYFDGPDYELEPMVHINEIFTRVDWRNLDTDLDYQFIRVEGTAAAEEAAEVVDAVARFRAKSQAYVVTNAVKVEGLAEFDQLTEMSLEQITSFNVLEALLAELTEEEGKVVKELLT